MNLDELSALQIAADEKRGFPVHFDNDRDKLDQIMKDLVGLFGEIGEFANLLKKVTIKTEHANYTGPLLLEAKAHLQEELADCLIYVMRIAATLDANLEVEFLKKLEINKIRYANLEID